MFLITLAPEVILIEDDNAAETTFFHSQASLITSSLFSAEKVVCTLSYKCLTLGGFCYSSDSVSSSSSVSSAFILSALASGSADLMLFFNFSMHMRAHFYIDISVNLVINDINVVCRVIEESETCMMLL
ncbi:uncharacterized protein BDCG_16826 [Blastomyces dermatitidis ER-3]|uniref:Uncharacterized protein n=1 Tax=Ajellomyces dermatitidis (strain ER-3 / ATCC MYA-2586) TaxID=559297 RepID=A0ABX2VUY4_AJEDR|nr:uncharacterized protein BDCG_16826 [Blastomyces dermatitidis ER-3]OAT00974.1 hypothetical protein BDCG_16826 [Blastomyces dermatitidis ER-3]